MWRVLPCAYFGRRAVSAAQFLSAAGSGTCIVGDAPASAHIPTILVLFGPLPSQRKRVAVLPIYGTNTLAMEPHSRRSGASRFIPGSTGPYSPWGRRCNLRSPSPPPSRSSPISSQGPRARLSSGPDRTRGGHVPKIAFLLTIALLAGCGNRPLPVAQAEDVYASIRRAEVERARARPAPAGKAPHQITERNVRKSQL